MQSIMMMNRMNMRVSLAIKPKSMVLQPMRSLMPMSMFNFASVSAAVGRQDPIKDDSSAEGD